MSRPSAKLCAECFPGALRVSRGVRPARLRGAAREKSYATERRILDTPRPSRASPGCASSARILRPQLAGRSQKARGLATVTDGAAGGEKKSSAAPKDGPLGEYNVRVEEGRLRDDEYQRGKWTTLWRRGPEPGKVSRVPN